jgi:hypothetical protein
MHSRPLLTSSASSIIPLKLGVRVDKRAYCAVNGVNKVLP